MDRYFKSNLQKKECEFTKLGRAVCVLGKTGIGKSWAIHAALDPCVEITPEILKSKQDTIEVLVKIRGTKLDVILDEYECVCNLVGMKEITSIPTEGRFIVISQIPVKFDFEIVTYNFPVPTHEDIKNIFPAASDVIIEESDGDLRWVQHALQFKSDFKDDFKGPKDFVTSLVSRKTTINPSKFIGKPLAEPGNMASILNANYLDSPNVNYENVSEILSQADIIEDIVYSGDWELMTYFNMWGCIFPAIEIGHTLGSELKPGSSWTKYQNMCMRKKKIKAMYERIPRTPLDTQGVMLIMSYIETDEKKAIELMKEYGFKKEDIDMLNHLCMKKNLKAKTVCYLKKCVSANT